MQALLRFPGLQQILRWTYVLSHGISPGVCTIDLVPQFGLPAEVGMLQILFGSVRLQFPECAIDAARVRRSSAGMVIGLTLLDRRWKWKFGSINGRYNLRTKSGRLDLATEKTPQQLATLLLAALGESGFSVAELPNLSRPEVDWSAANPAAELASLCDASGCRIVLGIDNRVSICRSGTGAVLPALDSQRTQSFGIDPPARPDRLQLIAGPTRFQTQFRLEAIGEDRDGTLRPIAELSYKPAEGWGTEPPGHFPNVANADDRARARRTVYRGYRIKCTSPDDAAGVFRLPGMHGPVSELWQLLPLESGLIDTERGPDGIERSRPFLVEGSYWNGSADGENLASGRIEVRGMTLDTGRGIVWFAEPMVKRNLADDTFLPAELYLTVAHSMCERETRQPARYQLDRPTPGTPLGTGPFVVRREELGLTCVSRYSTNHSPTQVITNENELAVEANASLDAALVQFQTLLSADAEYAGIIPIEPDGAISQVAWSGSPRGAFTRASRNAEFSVLVPTARERRAAEVNRLAQENTRRMLRAQARLLRDER